MCSRFKGMMATPWALIPTLLQVYRAMKAKGTAVDRCACVRAHEGRGCCRRLACAHRSAPWLARHPRAPARDPVPLRTPLWPHTCRVAWNTLVWGFAHSGDMQRARAAVQQARLHGFEPDARAWSSLLHVRPGQASRVLRGPAAQAACTHTRVGSWPCGRRRTFQPPCCSPAACTLLQRRHCALCTDALSAVH